MSDVDSKNVSPSAALNNAESLATLQDEVYEFRRLLELALLQNNPQVWEKIHQFMVNFSSNFPGVPEPEIFFILARKKYAKFIARASDKVKMDLNKAKLIDFNLFKLKKFITQLKEALQKDLVDLDNSTQAQQLIENIEAYMNSGGVLSCKKQWAEIRVLLHELESRVQSGREKQSINFEF